MLQIMPRNIWLECFGQNPPLLGPADVLSELIAPPRQPPHLHVLSYCSTATGDAAADQVEQPTRATGEIRERPGRELPERRQRVCHVESAPRSAARRPPPTGRPPPAPECSCTSSAPA